ncbi:MAG: ester cyclase [Acidobacteriota bacterium]
MAEKPDGGTPSERLRTVRDHIRFENAHDLPAVLATFGSSARYDDEPWDEHHMGHDAVRSFYEDLLRALPDLQIDVKKEHAAPDAVIVECVIRGTHGGTWRDLPATFRHVEFPLCGVYTFDDDGKLAGEKIYYDRATVLRQCGVFREPTSASGRILLFLNHPLNILSALLRKRR